MSECKKCESYKKEISEFITRIRELPSQGLDDARERIILEVLEDCEFQAIVQYTLSNIRYYGEVVKFNKVPKVMTYVYKILNTDGSIKKYGYSLNWRYIREVDVNIKNAFSSGSLSLIESSISPRITDIWLLDNNRNEFKMESVTMFNVESESKFKNFIDKIDTGFFGDLVYHIN